MVILSSRNMPVRAAPLHDPALRNNTCWTQHQISEPAHAADAAPAKVAGNQLPIQLPFSWVLRNGLQQEGTVLSQPARGAGWEGRRELPNQAQEMLVRKKRELMRSTHLVNGRRCEGWAQGWAAGCGELGAKR